MNGLNDAYAESAIKKAISWMLATGQAAAKLGVTKKYADKLKKVSAGPKPPKRHKAKREEVGHPSRLISKLRLREIMAIEAANSCLPEFIADYNRWFTVKARYGTLPLRLDALAQGDRLLPIRRIPKERGQRLVVRVRRKKASGAEAKARGQAEVRTRSESSVEKIRFKNEEKLETNRWIMTKAESRFQKIPRIFIKQIVKTQTYILDKPSILITILHAQNIDGLYGLSDRGVDVCP